jgi:hypothetical protein
MNIQLKIQGVNSILTGDYKSHNYNSSWIAKNTPTPKAGNHYEYLRQDAPFYCSSSLGVMLNYYQTKSDFSGFIDNISERLSSTNFPENSLNEIINWIVFQTIDCIVQEKSDKTDLQNVGWWMGRAVYVACIVSINYNAQYEKLFIESWKQYFTSETIDN